MEYRQHLTKIRECIDCNHAIIKKLIDIGNTLFVNGPEHCYSSGESMMFNSDGHEMEKVNYTNLINLNNSLSCMLIRIF